MVEIAWQRAGHGVVTVQVTEQGVTSEHHALALRHDGDSVEVVVDGVRYAARVIAVTGNDVHQGGLQDGDTLYLHFGDGKAILTLALRLPAPAGVQAEPGTLLAPTPGTVTAVLVAVGDAVRAGDPLVTREAMKMAHTVTAPDDGLVTELRVVVGDAIEAGALLARGGSTKSQIRLLRCFKHFNTAGSFAYAIGHEAAEGQALRTWTVAARTIERRISAEYRYIRRLTCSCANRPSPERVPHPAPQAAWKFG